MFFLFEKSARLALFRLESLLYSACEILSGFQFDSKTQTTTTKQNNNHKKRGVGWGRGGGIKKERGGVESGSGQVYLLAPLQLKHGFYLMRIVSWCNNPKLILFTFDLYGQPMDQCNDVFLYICFVTVFDVLLQLILFSMWILWCQNIFNAVLVVLIINIICSVKAKSKISGLELSIQQAQTIERQMLEMSQWMSEMGQHLQSRLDADLLAGDVPQESEVCFCVSILSCERNLTNLF